MSRLLSRHLPAYKAEKETTKQVKKLRKKPAKKKVGG